MCLETASRLITNRSARAKKAVSSRSSVSVAGYEGSSTEPKVSSPAGS